MTDPKPMTLDEARKIYPPLWTIYRQPRDFPYHWVVRVWFGEIPDPHHALCLSLISAREYVQQAGGSFCLRRDPGDDPAIAESWI